MTAAAVAVGWAGMAAAEPGWQKPVVAECALAPAADCNVEATCPADAPYVVTGGGGMPKADPQDHAVGITMNLPVSEGVWRVRWRNLSADTPANVKVAVRVNCAATAEEAGW